MAEDKDILKYLMRSSICDNCKYLYVDELMWVKECLKDKEPQSYYTSYVHLHYYCKSYERIE